MEDTTALYALQGSIRALDWGFSRSYLSWGQRVGGWTYVWGRDVYRGRIQETISRIDVQCFRLARLALAMSAAGAIGDTSRARALVQEQVRLGAEPNARDSCSLIR